MLGKGIFFIFEPFLEIADFGTKLFLDFFYFAEGGGMGALEIKLHQTRLRREYLDLVEQ